MLNKRIYIIFLFGILFICGSMSVLVNNIVTKRETANEKEVLVTLNQIKVLVDAQIQSSELDDEINEYLGNNTSRGIYIGNTNQIETKYLESELPGLYNSIRNELNDVSKTTCTATQRYGMRLEISRDKVCTVKMCDWKEYNVIKAMYNSFMFCSE